MGLLRCTLWLHECKATVKRRWELIVTYYYGGSIFQTDSIAKALTTLNQRRVMLTLIRLSFTLILVWSRLKLELHEQQNCCNLQQNLISTHVNWKCLHINYKSQGNMCRYFYLTCVEIRFCCKLQQFCCSCNSSFKCFTWLCKITAINTHLYTRTTVIQQPKKQYNTKRSNAIELAMAKMITDRMLWNK
jgi:hypothetical protein